MRDPRKVRELADAVSQKVGTECPGVRWQATYALQGRFHVVDIVEADDPAEVEKAAAIIQRCGHASTETMQAKPWKDFLTSLSAEQAGSQRGWRWELGHSGGF